ncbi:hypothetical protein ACNF42_07615 [Cuniculiplasma sp. SKW3]|uniref:hypothetical protein n=1 Tax=Cuniculiplasma sp. SKW3 TaxID=3400170 RepID=UPI003FD051D8
MNSTKVIAIILGILMVGFAGAFVYVYSDLNAHSQNSPAVTSDQVLGDAFSHWNDISIENSTLLGSQYASNASLQWIGGPLSGTYSGISSITATWNKFFNLWGAVWFYTISPPSVSVDGQYATVQSQNQFVVTPVNAPYQVQYINVSYNLVYSTSTNLIQKEVWKITGTGFISTNDQNASINEITSLAFSHWNNIAIENISTVMSEYAGNATLNWASGPLKGVYNGTVSIQSTWNKFFGLWNAVWFYTEAPPVVTIHGNVATVNATVQFIVQSSSNISKFMYINVTYGLKYMETGFNVHDGIFQYQIVYENFDNTAIGPINKV